SETTSIRRPARPRKISSSRQSRRATAIATAVKCSALIRPSWRRPWTTICRFEIVTGSKPVTDLSPIAGKLANFIRLLASDKEGEVVAASRALIRTLQSIGSDIHDLADHIEHSNGALSDHEMQEIFDAGVERGVKLTEQKLRNNREVAV